MSVADKNYNYGLVHKEPNFKKACCILMTRREDAKNALDLLFSILNRYGVVTVYDLYTAVGAKTSSEDDLIGWESLKGSLIKPTVNKKEYRLILPKLNYDGRDYVNYD